MNSSELMQRLRDLPRIKKVLILIAGPLGSIGLGMLDHPFLALFWYLGLTILFVNVTKPAAEMVTPATAIAHEHAADEGTAQ